MNAEFAADWIQYLKNNQIISTRSDPATGKLVYRRPVFANDVARFLERKCDIDGDVADRLIESVVPDASLAIAQLVEQDGFVDRPGVEIKESDVKAIFSRAHAHIQQAEREWRDQEQAALEQEEAARCARVRDAWVDGLEQVAKAFTPEQRMAFVSLVHVMRSGFVPLRPIQISGTIKALIDDCSVAQPKKGFFATLVSRKLETPVGPSADELEHRWLEAGAPMDDKSFVDFLAYHGFDRERSDLALRNSMLDPSVETYTSERAFEMMIELAERVKDADEDKLAEQFELIRSMRDEDADKEA